MKRRAVPLSYTAEMNVLAFDLSTERLCLALVRGDAVLGHEEEGAARASQRLLPAAGELLSRHGLSWKELDGVAAAIGPGAFTGLRAACSAAQGLALGLGIPALGVSSLLVVAVAAHTACCLGEPPVPTVYRVAVDARMDQVYDATFGWDGFGWTTLEEARVRSPQEVAAAWIPSAVGVNTSPVVWAGSGVALMPAHAVETARHSGVRVLGDPPERALALGACARRSWVQGGAVDAALLMPVYVRDRVAMTTRERLGLAGGV